MTLTLMRLLCFSGSCKVCEKSIKLVRQYNSVIVTHAKEDSVSECLIKYK